jgi:hypothetical protein
MEPITTTQTAPVVPKLPVPTPEPTPRAGALMTKAPVAQPATVVALLLELLDVVIAVDRLLLDVELVVDGWVVETVDVEPAEVAPVDVVPWTVVLPLIEPAGVVPVALLPDVPLLAPLESAVDVLPLPGPTHRFATQLSPGSHAPPAVQMQFWAPTAQS